MSIRQFYDDIFELLPEYCPLAIRSNGWICPPDMSDGQILDEVMSSYVRWSMCLVWRHDDMTTFVALSWSDEYDVWWSILYPRHVRWKIILGWYDDNCRTGMFWWPACLMGMGVDNLVSVSYVTSWWQLRWQLGYLWTWEIILIIRGVHQLCPSVV